MDICEVRVSGDGKELHKHGYTDELLHDIGRKFPGQWKKFGVYLGIGYDRLEKMVRVKSCQEMSMEMFREWWSITSPHVRWGELHHAYVCIHRQDLLASTQDYFKRHDIDYNNPEQTMMDQYFFTMSGLLPRDWKDLGLHLGLSSEKIASIGQQPEQDMSLHGFRVLKMWQASAKSSHHQLIRVMMDDMQRSDVARFILKHFEQRTTGPTIDNNVVCDCGVDHVNPGST